MIGSSIGLLLIDVFGHFKRTIFPFSGAQVEDVYGNRWRRDGFASCKGKLVCVVFGASLRTCTVLIDVSCCFRDFQSVSFLIKSSNELQTLNQVRTGHEGPCEVPPALHLPSIAYLF